MKKIKQKIKHVERLFGEEKIISLIKEILGGSKRTREPRYIINIRAEKDGGIPFDVKMKKLTGELEKYFEEGRKLEEKVKMNLKKINY